MRASNPPLPAAIPGCPRENPVVTTAIGNATVLGVAAFSGSAASLIAYTRVRSRHRAECGTPPARSVTPITAQPRKRFATRRLSKNSGPPRVSPVAAAIAVSPWDERGPWAAAQAGAGRGGRVRPITPRPFIPRAAANDKTVLVAAPQPAAEANARNGLRLPPGDDETLAGFVLNQSGRRPRVGEDSAWATPVPSGHAPGTANQTARANPGLPGLFTNTINSDGTEESEQPL